MNRPNRYIKREALAPFTSDISVAQLKAYYQDKDWMLERLDRLEYDLSIMKRMSPYAAIHYLSNAMKYQDYLKDYAKEHHINEQELLDVLNAVHEVASHAAPLPSGLLTSTLIQRNCKSRQKALLQMMQIMKAVSVFAHFTVQRD